MSTVARIPGVCCGQAYILRFPDGNNSIIISGGANMAWNGLNPFNEAQLAAIKKSSGSITNE